MPTDPTREGVAANERGQWYENATAAGNEAGWKNPAHVGAFRKGWLARISGRPRSSPYLDRRTVTRRNMVTFSRSFMAAWEDGWDAAGDALNDATHDAQTAGMVPLA